MDPVGKILNEEDINSMGEVLKLMDKIKKEGKVEDYNKLVKWHNNRRDSLFVPVAKNIKKTISHLKKYVRR